MSVGQLCLSKSPKILKSLTYYLTKVNVIHRTVNQFIWFKPRLPYLILLFFQLNEYSFC